MRNVWKRAKGPYKVRGVRGVRGTVRGVRGMRGTQKIKKNFKNIFKNIKKYKISKMVFFNTKKKLVSTGFEPTTSRSPAKHLIHLSYENIWIYSSINLLFICAITRAFPSEPDSGTPPRVFYRPVLVLVAFWDLRTSCLNLFSNLLQSPSIKHQHQASAIILIQQ